MIALLILVLVLTLAWTRLYFLANTLGRNVDEGAWIASALHYTDLVVGGDFSSPAWEGDNLGLYGSINPHLGEIWLGVFLRLDPVTRHLHLNRNDELRLTHDLFADPSPIIGPTTLEVARLAHAASGLLCLALVFAVGYRVAGIAAAVLATSLVSMSAAFEQVMARTLTDGVYNALLLAATFALVEFFDARAKTAAGWIAVSGAMFGLAFNAKMTALILGWPILAALVAMRNWRVPTRPAVAALLFTLGAATSIVTAYAANPYFWPNASPPAGGGKIEMFRLALNPPRSDNYSPVRGTAPVALRLFESHFRWKRQMADQLVYLSEHYGYSSPSRSTIIRRVVFTYNHRWWGLALVLLAATQLIVLFAQGKSKQLDLLAVPLVATIGTVAFLVAAQNLDWDRYYLPAVFQVHLLEACVLATAVTVWSANCRESWANPSR